MWKALEWNNNNNNNNKRKRICKIVDFAVPADHRIKLKESEKKDKYLDLARELKNLWNMKVTIVPIVIGALGTVLYFDLRPGPKILFQGNTPEGSDTFQRPVIERDRVGGLRLMIWEKVKVLLCHYSDAPEESNLWTAWQLFPLDDD